MLVEKVVSLRELEEFWSIDDILDANDVLDAYRAAEERARKRP